MSATAVEIVKTSLITFNLLGSFGNLNIIIITIKHREFKSKHGKSFNYDVLT